MLYYTPDRKVWSVDVTSTPEFRAATPKLLGQVPEGNHATTPDVQRLLIGVPAGGLEEITPKASWSDSSQKRFRLKPPLLSLSPAIQFC